MASCCEDKDPAGEVLQLLKTSLSLGKCQENYRSTYKPFLVSCIHSEGKEERLALLKRCFQIEVSRSYPGEYDSEGLLLDLVEQAVAYAVERGLPGHEICYFLSFYVSCLDAVATNASNEDQTLAKVIQQLQGQIIPTYSNYLSPTSLRYSVEYITTSILQHFHLYQFLLTYTQTTDLTTLEVPVETPVKSPPCLQDAVTEDVWLNWKKKEEMEAEYEKTLKELEETGEEAKLLADMNLKMVCETQLADISNQPVSKERLADIVEALLKAHMDLARVPIEQILLKQDVDMDYRLDQMEALPELSEVLTRLKGQGNSSPNLPSRKNTSRPPK